MVSLLDIFLSTVEIETLCIFADILNVFTMFL